MSQQFIGFADSDKFLGAIDPTKPINLNVSRKYGKPDHRFGISVDSTVITMSQVRGNEVLYFEHATHRFQVANGHVMDLDEEKHIRLGTEVQAAAELYLTDHCLTWRDALLSMPRTYTHLDGVATFLTYDKENGGHYRYSKVQAVNA